MTAVSNLQLKRSPWQTIVLLTLGLWLGASLILDWVIMPSLYVSGMMTQAGFTSAGYLIFWNFNRIELVAAAVVLTSVLALNQTAFVSKNWRRGAVILSGLMLAVALTNAYFLTPQMCATGIQLNFFATVQEVPATMNNLHVAYWLLEATKLAVGGTLLGWCFRQEV